MSKRKLDDITPTTYDEVSHYTVSELMEYLSNEHGLNLALFPEQFKTYTTGKDFLNTPFNPRLPTFIDYGVSTTISRQLIHIIDDLAWQKKRSSDMYVQSQQRWDAIMNMQYTSDELAKPSKFMALPFPDVSFRKPYDSFGPAMKDGTFIYQGRHHYLTIRQAVMGMKEYEGAAKAVYINGCMGVGKSFILAALVCDLRKSGEQVLYLPDCKEFLSTPVGYLRYAFSAAFANDEGRLKEIDQCTSEEQFIAFASGLGQNGVRLFVIIDQTNALDPGSMGNHRIDEKARVTSLIAQLGQNHYLIKSASANFELVIQARVTQVNVFNINPYEGLNDEEMECWWEYYSSKLPKFSTEFRSKVEDLSGRNPLLLRAVYQAVGPYKDYELEDNVVVEVNDTESSPTVAESIQTVKENDFWKMIHASNEWRDTAIRLLQFATEHSRVDRKKYLESLEKCILGYSIEPTDSYIDFRYFYADSKGKARYSCGLARNVLAARLCSEVQDLLTSDYWTDLISMSAVNSSSLGFSLSIDAVWVTLDDGHDPKHDESDSHTRKVHITLVQVTINKDHSDSETVFFTHWQEFIMELVGGRFQYEVNFLWIVEDQPNFRWQEAFVSENYRCLRSGRKLIHPAYHRKVIEIGNAFPIVGKELAAARAR